MKNTPRVFVNRTLNLRKIRYIGFDMDHTLIRYDAHAFEEFAHKTMCQRLVEQKNYPEAVLKLPFSYDLAVRGLVLDRKKGNLLKVSRFGGIRQSYHGTKPIDFLQQQKLYRSTYIDLTDTSNYSSIDTAFSISVATLFAQLVDIKEQLVGQEIPDFDTIATDVVETLDMAHRDGSLKSQVAKDLNRFIIRDPAVVEGLERYRKHDKELFILTNSDYAYSRVLLDYAITPFLKNHKCWSDLFTLVITHAQKPRFFYDNLPFLLINPKDGSMQNFDKPLKRGIYQGGCAEKFSKDLGVDGDDILYIGDHIYGDILRLKKDCNWRTALVIEELDEEIEKYQQAKPFSLEIEKLMGEKGPLEEKMVDLVSNKIEHQKEAEEATIQGLQAKITDIDKKISQLIKKKQILFNSHWGEVMRSGNEDSYFAYQVDRFACIYMPKINDLFSYSPRTYFRANRRPMAHELALDLP